MGKIFEAFEANGFKEYDAFVSVVKDTIAPKDNALAYKVEDTLNDRLSKVFADIENTYIYNERKSYLVGVIKNAILLRGTLSPIKADEDNIYPTYCGNIRHEHVSEVYLDEDGVVCVSTFYKGESGENKYDVFRCDEFANDEIVAIAHIIGVTIAECAVAPHTMKFNSLYFVRASEEWNESVLEYYNKTPYNYVIIDNGNVITWEDGNPVIYGDKEDAINELCNWSGNITNVSIITEREFVDTYCKDEIYQQLKAEADAKAEAEKASSTIMDEGFSHNQDLVKKINEAWRTKREEFKPILCALYRRDIDEITSEDGFMEERWTSSEEYRIGEETKDWSKYFDLVLNDMVAEWDFWAYQYLMQIADDTDLICILNYLHVEV